MKAPCCVSEALIERCRGRPLVAREGEQQRQRAKERRVVGTGLLVEG
jgi:hypothetical protein